MSSSSSKKRKNVDSLPSRDEQQLLRETDLLLKTNLANSKVAEMLDEVSTELPDTTSGIGKWSQKVIDLFINMKDMAGISKAWVEKKGLLALAPKSGYLLKRGEKRKLELNFKAPDTCSMCGSYALGTQTKPYVSVDILVTIPVDCLEREEDIRNHTYFEKRRIYLAVLAHALQKSGLVDEQSGIRVVLFKGDDRKPILLVQSPSRKNKKHYTLRIIPCVHAETFELKSLRGSRNNVRPREWLEATDSKLLDKHLLKPTPSYNHCILEDVAHAQQTAILQTVADSVPVFRKAAILLKIWLHQQGFRGMLDSLDSHTASLLLLHVLETNRSSAQMHPLGVFQLVVKFLASTDLSRPDLYFANTANGAGRRVDQGEDLPTADAYLLYPVTDGAGNVLFTNLLWRISASALVELKESAQHTLTVLQQEPGRVYERIFSTRLTFWNRYDLIYAIPLRDDDVDDDDDDDDDEGDSMEIRAKAQREEEEACLDNPLLYHVARKAAIVITRALGDRARSLRIMPDFLSRAADPKASASSHCAETPVETAFSGEMPRVLIGVVLDSDKSLRSVERGPSPEDEAAAADFVDFWGASVAQLRRFRDGSIVHAVAWCVDSSAPKTGTRVTDECVRYTVGRHLPAHGGKGGKRLLHTGAAVEHALRDVEGHGDDVVSASVLAAVKSLDTLKGILCSDLDGIALRVETVSPTSSQLRYTSLVCPRRHPLLMPKADRVLNGERLSLIQVPMCVVGTLEQSGKWPTDKTVAAKLKTSLLLQISAALKRQHTIVSVPHEDYLDIVWDGFLFRLELSTSAEKNTWVYLPLESIPEDVREATLAPLHHSVVHSFQGLHPSYGDAVRLLRYWMAKSTFSGVIPGEVLELVVASAYLNPPRGSAPSTAERGFRDSLALLAAFDWEGTALVINFSGDISSDDVTKIQLDLQTARASPQSPGPSMYCVASYDQVMGYRPHFARLAPERVMLQMICAASRATCAYLDAHDLKYLCGGRGPGGAKASWRTVLQHAAEHSSVLKNHISFLLVFNKALAYSGKRYMGGLAACASLGPAFAHAKFFANSPAAELSHTRLVSLGGTSLCPVQENLVTSLRIAYGHYALFFWDETVGSRLGVVLRPRACLPTKFSVLDARHRIVVPGRAQAEPSKDVPLTVLNTTELVAEMMALADGCIDDVVFL